MKMDSNNLFIPAPYSYYSVMKDKLNGIWSAKHQAWRFPKSVHALDEVVKYVPEVAKTDSFKEVYDLLKRGRDHLRSYKNKNLEQDKSDRLRYYQRQDVEYLKKIPCGGVFNEPRTGKTPTMIHVVKELGSWRTMVIAPASLIYNWKNEIEKFDELASVIIANGTPAQRVEIYNKFFATSDRPMYLIVSKDTAKRDVEHLKYPHDVCIVDEAHYLRNIETAQTSAIYTVSYNAKRRYALTGTPSVKHPSDVYGILKFLYPYKFTSKWGFYERYFYIDDNGFGKSVGKPKPNRVEELQDLLDAMSTQRLRKDVMSWLPDKEYHTHYCEMSKEQKKLYKSMLEDFFAKKDDVEIDTQNVLAQLMRLRQLCLDPTLLGFDCDSAKTEALIEAVENNTYGRPLVIMSSFTSYLKKLKDEFELLGKTVGMITGEITNKEKNDAAQAFQRGELDILLCNIISAGTGFTLDTGDTVIFTDKAWNPSENQQAEDRVCPTSEDKLHKHTVVSMVCVDSVDVKIEKLLENKESLTAVVNKCKNYKELKDYLFTFNM